MDARTLTALKGSIAKWQAIVDGTGADCGGMNCPLCHAFLRGKCRRCPVLAATGLADCHGTPFDDWHKATAASNFPPTVTPETLPLAQAELAFLQSLLPEEA